MVSEGSCDTEDGSNGFWKFSFVITDINYILKYIQIENLFKMQYFTILLHQLNAALSKHFQKHLLTPTFYYKWIVSAIMFQSVKT